MEDKENVPVAFANPGFCSPSRQRHQDLYKRTPDWKKKYKDRCKQRLRANRTKLVDQFRGINIVDHVMRDEVKSKCEFDLVMSLYDELRQELLEEEAALALLEAPDFDPDEVTEHVGAPCPSCSRPLSGEEGCMCVSCDLAVSVSSECLHSSYSTWFSAHLDTGCSWEPDVSVQFDHGHPDGLGQVVISCDGCENRDFIPNILVKRLK